MFPVRLRWMWILLLLNKVFYECLLSIRSNWLIVLQVIYFLSPCFISYWKRSVETFSLNCRFATSPFRGADLWCMCSESLWLGSHRFRNVRPSWRTDLYYYVILLLIPDNLLYFKIYFIWNCYRYSCFLLASVRMVHFFYPLSFNLS